MKVQYALAAMTAYLYLHWLLANNKVPEVLIPLAKKIEIEELTAVIAAV